jgi:aspartate/methionine/tyrosine aminotransferase
MNSVVSNSSKVLGPEPRRIVRLQLPGRVASASASARAADLQLLAAAPAPFLDTTHFDTVRFAPPPWAHEAFAEAAAQGENAYSPYRGHAGVLAEVAKNVSEFLGVPVDPARNLILTPGTQAGLFTSLGAIVEEGDRVAIFDPEYLFSERILRYLGADVAPVPLLLNGADGPTPDLEVLEHEFSRKKTRFLVFSHPNNPTGAVYGEGVIRTIASLANRYGVTVLVDELYSRLVYGDRRFFHLAAQPGMFERTITLLGPSKTESLSGYRLGVVVATGGTIDRIENMLSIVSLRAPAYSQYLLTRWLRDDRDWLAARMKEFSALQALTERKFRALPWIGLFTGQGTAYSWPDVSALDMSGPSVAEALLRRAGVLVSPGYQFGATSNGHFRVCYARDEVEWADALDRMVEVLSDLQRRGSAAGAGS